MRVAFAACLAWCAACGDNAPECGRTEILAANRNIWGGQIAVDAERVYYSDYDNGVGTHLVFREPREGGDALVIAAHGERNAFGWGMAIGDDALYWSAENPESGYYLLATPLLGGRTLDLGAISFCPAHGVAVDEVAAYAGSIHCDAGPAIVTAVPRDGTPQHELWRSSDADVQGIAASGGEVWIATTEGLVHVLADGTQELVDPQPSYQAIVADGQLYYSTYEKIAVMPLAGGAARRLYTYATPILDPRPFAVDAGDVYIALGRQLFFLPAGGSEPQVLVHDMGAAITNVTARDGAVYWPTLAAPSQLELLDTFSGGVFRAVRPCQ